MEVSAAIGGPLCEASSEEKSLWRMAYGTGLKRESRIGNGSDPITCYTP
jgi:hypothetical protein